MHATLFIVNVLYLSMHQLLDRDEFRCITKIKTIGSTYMAASGLTPESITNGYSSHKVRYISTLCLRNMSFDLSVKLCRTN